MSSYALREKRDGKRRLLISLKRISFTEKPIDRSDFLIIMGLLDTFTFEQYALNEPYVWISEWVKE